MALNIHLSNTTAYAAVVEALVRGGGTVPDLSETSGLALNTTRKFLRALRTRALIRVVLWRQDAWGRYTIAVWGWGSGPDVKRPPRMTPTERSARRRRRKQSEMSSMRSMERGARDAHATPQA